MPYKICSRTRGIYKEQIQISYGVVGINDVEDKEILTAEGTAIGLIWNAMCMVILVAGLHPPTQELIAALMTLCMNAAMTTKRTIETPLSRRPHVELVYAAF